jgi:hypothetical protein
MPATRGSAWSTAAVAVSLGVMSYLHLRGPLGSTGTPPFDPSAAGIAEALIGGVLFAAAMVALLAPHLARPVLLGATGFAVAGFGVAITITVSGGDAADIAYHATVLPILVVILLSTLRAGRSTPVASAR